jgi:hypothetical protein
MPIKKNACIEDVHCYNLGWNTAIFIEAFRGIPQPLKENAL